MLKVALDLRVHLDGFCSYIHTEEGRLKFNNCSKIVPISHEQWFMLENVRNILDLFDNATEVLSGGKYSTWSLTVPVLRTIKDCLHEYKVTNMISHARWYEDTKATVVLFRDQILKEFTNRFRGMQGSLLWTILLDPRLTAMNGFTSGERSRAKQWLIEEMNEVAIHIRSFQDLERKDNTPDDTLDDTQPSGKNAFFNKVFTARRKIDENAEGDTQKSIENELEKYLALCQETNVRDPLLWWKTHCKDFPVLAWLSRKWLSAVSTSVSSERLFSRTGATVTARRARLNDDHVEMLTYIHDNMNLS